MVTTEYLYSIDPKVLKGLGYEEALHFKVKKAKEVKTQCAKDARLLLENPAGYNDVMLRYEAAGDAVEFNNQLIEELS